MPPKLSNASGTDLYARKSFNWSSRDAPKDPAPQKPKTADPPAVCSCGNVFVRHATFCPRCGALRDAQPPPEEPPVAEPGDPVAAAAEEEGGTRWWSYNPPETRPLAVRNAPGANAEKTREMLHPGDVFEVAEELAGDNGVLYLRLADGRGWVMEGMPGVGSLCQRAGGGVGADVRKLEKGMKVRTTGLVSRPELNGKTGLLKGWNVEKERWKVTMDDGSGTKLLREENLELFDGWLKDGATAKGNAKDAQTAAKAETAQVEAAATPPKTSSICTCGTVLVPHATFCARCGTLRSALPPPVVESAPQAPQKRQETPEEFNRRIEAMLTSGEMEWEDW